MADHRRGPYRAAPSRVHVPLPRVTPATVRPGPVPGSAVRGEAGAAAARARAVRAAERGDLRAAPPARPGARPPSGPAPFPADDGSLNVRERAGAQRPLHPVTGLDHDAG